MAQSENHSIKPVITCQADSCKDCNVRGIISCHFSLSQYIKFMISAIPGILLGAIGITRIDSCFLIPWILFCVIFFSLIETRVLCSHCPHYGEAGIFLRCWAALGLLKLWKWRLGPLSIMEKIILLGGFLLIWLYPLPFLVIGKMWILLMGYSLSTVGFFVILQLQFCSHCINLYCPLNRVPANVRNEFYKKFIFNNL